MDFDKTLAYYDYSRGKTHLGDPIPLMVQRVQRWLAAEQEVRIFTARAMSPESAALIKLWSAEHIGQVLPVTNIKDYTMAALYDDKAIQVEPNTGRLIGGRN